MARVKLEKLTKKFGKVVAVNNLSLEVKDKDFVVLLGPSGCGKTTTLRMIAGLDEPDAGEIYMGERPVKNLPSKDRDIAMVFQNYALYPTMSVFNNIAFPLKIRKVPKEEIKRKVKETADLLGISQLLDRKPGQISGGEAQRTALGRAIIREPKVFLMDEPLSNLDAKLRVHMRMELKRLQKELGITTIYVTHDQIEAMAMADQIAIMNLGVLQQLGSPSEVYDHPANMFVAGFIGSPPINFIECTLIEKNGGAYLDTGIFAFAVPSEIEKIMKEKITTSELTIGFRPEDISISRDQTEESIKANVYVVEPLGSEVIVDLRVRNNLIKARTTPNFIPSVGEEVYITFNKNRMHIFDKKTEVAII